MPSIQSFKLKARSGGPGRGSIPAKRYPDRLLFTVQYDGENLKFTLNLTADGSYRSETTQNQYGWAIALGWNEEDGVWYLDAAGPNNAFLILWEIGGVPDLPLDTTFISWTELSNTGDSASNPKIGPAGGGFLPLIAS